MIYETYCSYKVAKLLKEKGFPQDYDLYNSIVYNEEDYEDEYEVQRMVTQTRLVKAGTLSSYPAGVPGPKCFCPTHQMALKWLREVHNLQIIIIPIRSRSTQHKNWTFEIYKNFNPLDIDVFTFPTYEEDCEAALKYALENLI